MAQSLISHPAPNALRGTISLPGDKSISHRSVLLGAIAKGVTPVSGFLNSSDCQATIRALQSLGLTIEGPSNDNLLIHGVGKYGLRPPTETIDCGNSGTSLRLLAGLLAAQPFDSCLTGDASLLKRPMQRIIRPLELMGASIRSNQGCAPLHIRGTPGLQAIDYLIPEPSAQVKSCLLLAGLYAKGQTRITETAITRDHTERMLQTLEYPLTRDKATLILDNRSECLANPIIIPGDLSSAAFFIVAASLIPGSSLIIRGVGVNPSRTGVLSILSAMGADIRMDLVSEEPAEPLADLRIKYAPLQGITIPESLISLAIDEFPIIAIAASVATGTTLLRNAKELRYKESDRISALIQGLRTLGIQAEEFEDGFCIQGGHLKGGVVDSQGDHRLAMAFAIAGSLASHPVTIKGSDAIATSFPSFLPTAQNLQLPIEAGGVYA